VCLEELSCVLLIGLLFNKLVCSPPWGSGLDIQSVPSFIVGCTCHWPREADLGSLQARLAAAAEGLCPQGRQYRCNKIAEAEAAVSVHEKKWLVMHMHVQLKLDELRGPPNPWLTVT
jgi:hypothetical protein